ncbi:MAG: SulP family inorganic anion transporter, partial [Trueperaceae bacterium]|nr:SulP family inorganic anion transporter [Trueperaceae bacterium]
GAGAAAGLATAVVAGTLAAVFGGSSFQVSGPTGAMTVVLLPIVAAYGVAALPLLGLLAGGFLLLFAFAGIGRYVHYVPWPVVTGFTNGIATIIALQQLPGLLGVAGESGHGGILPASADAVAAFLAAPTWAAPVLGALTVAVMVAWPSWKRVNAVPAGIVAMAVVTLVSLLPGFGAVPRIGAIPSALPWPSLPPVPDLDLTVLIRAALAIAVLAALESLLSAVVADGMTVGERHDPDRELFGQGLANLGAAVMGGIPGTAALARTAVNVRSGARTRLAAVVHGLTLLAIVLVAAPLAARVPLAALAGILLVVAARMVEGHALRTILRSTKSDAFVLVLTMGVTVLFDLILALEVGLVAAGILFIVRVSRMFRIDPLEMLEATEAPRLDPSADADAEQRLLREQVVAYRVDGPMFFGAANRFFDQLLKTGGGIRVVVLRLRRVPVMDATGASALESLVDRLARRKIRVLLSGLQVQPREVLGRMGVLARLERAGSCVYDTSEEAIDAALRLVQDG